MALFKALRGGEASLASTPLHDGYVYYCIDTKNLFFDHKDESNNLVRSQINAKYADKLKYIKDGQTVEITPEMISSHTGNTTVHITSTERTNWNAAKTHADSTHARTDATKTEKSNTNGNIKINGTETTVYTHPSGTNPHGTTKSDVGLGNVGNFKAVSTVASQGLTDTEKSNARANIGAQVAGSYAPASHTSDTTAHITADERTKWNAKIDATAITTHNTSDAAHSDIRGLINTLTERLNTVANSSDEDLDQLSEIVAYIKNNKTLIDGITTSKVSVSDIINNLTTNVSNKPLSAAQGVALKGLIDTLQGVVDDKAESSTVNTHTGNADIHVTSAQKTAWTNKQDALTADTDYLTPSTAASTYQPKGSYASSSDLTSHTGNTTVHVTAEEKAKWDAGGNVFKGTVTVETDGTSTINLPFTIEDTNRLTVYYRGLLLTPETHYTATTSAITLVGFTANAGEIFTFVGNNSAGTSLNTSASQVLFSDTNNDYDGCTTVQEALVKVPSIIKTGVISYYGTCSTSANTESKVVTTLDSNFVLATGATVYVKFNDTNTISTITLNVDGTGAKSVKAYGETNMNTNMWNAGEIVQFTYDGTNWILNQVSAATTSTYGITRLSNTIDNASTNLAATANAVKTAYDKAVEAYNAIQGVVNNVSDLNAQVSSTYLAKSGGTMTGALVAQTNTSYTTRQVRNVILSTSEPTSSDGQNGDIWFVYEA